MFTGIKVTNTIMVSYHFKGSELEPLIVTIILEFHVELHIRQKFVSQTGTNEKVDCNSKLCQPSELKISFIWEFSSTESYVKQTTKEYILQNLMFYYNQGPILI